MPAATAVDTTVEGFPNPSLPNHSGNPDYKNTKETQQLLTANVASIECNLSGGQNSYLSLILPPEQYARVSGTAFVLLPNPGRTAQVPEWTTPTEETRINREHAEQIRLYDKYRNIDSDLKNQLLAVFDDLYLATLKNEYTRYAARSTWDLLDQLYKHYAHISLTDMSENDKII